MWFPKNRESTLWFVTLVNQRSNPAGDANPQAFYRGNSSLSRFHVLTGRTCNPSFFPSASRRCPKCSHICSSDDKTIIYMCVHYFNFPRLLHFSRFVSASRPKDSFGINLHFSPMKHSHEKPSSRCSGFGVWCFWVWRSQHYFLDRFLRIFLN